jgi:ABC-type transport system involved in cytochrome bd biosynthesis fused ATPase/permease subunit
MTAGRKKLQETLMQRKELSATVDPDSPDSKYSSVKTSDKNGSTENKPQGYLIEFEDINFTLKNGTTIMKGVYGSFQPGRLCAIMGPSGAGKSTVIGLVTGKTPRTGGTVKLNGEVVPGLMHIRKIVVMST